MHDVYGGADSCNTGGGLGDVGHYDSGGGNPEFGSGGVHTLERSNAAEPSDSWDGHPSAGLVFFFTSSANSMSWKTGSVEYDLAAIEACALQESCGGAHSLLEDGFYVIGPMRGLRLPRLSRLATPGGLALHERLLGGHTLREHVNVTREYLFQRMRESRYLPAASRFLDRAIAERAVYDALKANRSEIQRYLARGGTRGENFTHTFSRPIGEVLLRDAQAVIQGRGIVVTIVPYRGFEWGFRIVRAFVTP